MLRFKILKFMVFFVCCLFGNHLVAHERNKPETGPLKPYKLLLKDFRDLQKEYPTFITTHNYTSAAGNKGVVIRLRTPGNFKKRPAVYISDATHGEEYLGVVSQMPRYILENKEKLPAIESYLAKGGVFYLAPVLNPDGYIVAQGGDLIKSRRNGNNIDLNRDFPLDRIGQRGLTQPETRFVTNFLAEESRKGAQLKLTLDYHCCIPSGVILFPWGYRTPGFPEIQPPPISLESDMAHRRIGGQMQRLFPYGLGTPWSPVLASGEFLGGVVGASDDYFYESYFLNGEGTAFTFESSGKKQDLDINIHMAMWERVIDVINSEGSFKNQAAFIKNQTKIQ